MNELHLHIDGSLRPSTLKELRPDIDVVNFGFRKGMGLQKALDMFKVTVEAINSPRVLERITREICEDLREDGVEMGELRFAPHIHGCNALEMVEAASDGLQETDGLILCGLYGDHPRVFEELVSIASRNKRVLGIDIAGGPLPDHKYGLLDYAPAFQEAKKRLIPRTAHLSEGRRVDEIITAIQYLDVDRIGHATSLLSSNVAVEMVKAKSIVIEACPTSNVHTGIFENVGEHPIREWIKRGVKVAVCCDNTLMSRTTTQQEIVRLLRECKLQESDIQWINKSSVDGKFYRYLDS